VILLDGDYLHDRKVFGHVVCSFRYGREMDEVMGLNFQKDLFLASEQIYPPPKKWEHSLTKLQVTHSHFNFTELLELSVTLSSIL
jgi:arrestin-1